MDSKSGIPPPISNEEDAPPAYNDTTSPRIPAPKYQEPSDSSTRYYSRQIQDQLQSLTSQISSIQTQKKLDLQEKDEHILELLTAQIQIYLSDFASAGLPKGTLVLVPADAVEDENALPLDADSHSGDFYRVVCIKDKAADGGRNLMFWKDRSMAGRLVDYLSPGPKMGELPPRKPEPEKKIGSRFGWGKKDSKKSPVEEPPSPANTASVDPLLDSVTMNVKREELVFRTENDFGIYETKRGCGIILSLVVVIGGR